jgi:tripartite-type tricarboxylate transporter receptor subunit TctC
MVVAAAPGGTTDILARLMAAFLQQAWGQTCVVDNKSGAGGIIGSNEVVKAAPDGTTSLMGNVGPESIAYSLYSNMLFTPRSFAPVSCVLTAPNVLVVRPSVPAKTVPEFVAWLKAQNGKVSHASSGAGQSPYLSAAWFLQLTGTRAEHIPYRGAAPRASGPDGGRHPVLLRQSHLGDRVRARGQAQGARHHLGTTQSHGPRPDADLRDHARAQALRGLSDRGKRTVARNFRYFR